MERKELTAKKMKIDRVSISKLLVPVPKSYDNLLSRIPTNVEVCLHSYRNLINSTAGKELLAEMKKDHRVKALGKRIFVNGTPGHRFSVTGLGAWFLWMCNEHDLEIAKSQLDKFLDSETIPIIITTWVTGIEMEKSIKSIKLENGVCIIPIQEMPDSQDKEKFLMQRSRGEDSYGLLPMVAVTHICEIKKPFGPMELGKSVSQDPNAHKSQGLISQVVTLLNAIDSISCIQYMHATYSMPMMPMDIFEIWGGGSIYNVVGISSGKKIDERTINELNKILKEYGELPQNAQARISRSLLRLSQAKRRLDGMGRILDLCIALEMVLRGDNRGYNLSSMDFSLRGCWLIGRDGKHRKIVYDDLKRLYKYRSEIIHTGSLTAEYSKALGGLGKYTRLTEKIILAVMRKKNINWEELILGRDDLKE